MTTTGKRPRASSLWRRLTIPLPRTVTSPCGDFYFLAVGRRKEAVEQGEIAVRGDPLQLTVRSFMGMCLDSAGRHAEAEEHLRQTIALDPNFFWAWHFLSEHYAARQMFAEALPCAEKAFSLAPWYAQSVGVYAALLVRTGERDRGIELIQRLGSGEAYGASTGLALFHTCRGEIDPAADWFEKAIEERHSLIACSSAKRDRGTTARQPALAEISGADEPPRRSVISYYSRC